MCKQIDENRVGRVERGNNTKIFLLMKVKIVMAILFRNKNFDQEIGYIFLIEKIFIPHFVGNNGCPFTDSTHSLFLTFPQSTKNLLKFEARPHLYPKKRRSRFFHDHSILLHLENDRRKWDNNNPRFWKSFTPSLWYITKMQKGKRGRGGKGESCLNIRFSYGMWTLEPPS